MSNIEMAVRQHSPIEVSREVYPWINVSEATVNTVEVRVLGGSRFIYGSLIRLNGTISRIAEDVPVEDSASLQNVLFSGLSSTLSGIPHSGISKVEGSDSQIGTGTLFVASRNIVQKPSLLFAVDDRRAVDGLPLVLRAGVSTATDYPKVLGAMGIKQVGGRRRKS